MQQMSDDKSVNLFPPIIVIFCNKNQSISDAAKNLDYGKLDNGNKKTGISKIAISECGDSGNLNFNLDNGILTDKLGYLIENEYYLMCCKMTKLFQNSSIIMKSMSMSFL